MSTPEVIASGLQGTSGGTIGPDGALYVAEGITGEITRVDRRTGATSTYATGLPERVIEGLGGAIDVAFRGDTAYVLVTVVGPDVGGNAIDGIYRMDDADSFTVIADIGQHAVDNPPTFDFDIEVERGVQYALETVRGGFLVTDGHLNRVLYVGTGGEIREVIDFPNVVPTGIEVFRGRIHIALAGPVPHTPEDGRIVALSRRDGQARDIASGYSLLVDVERNRCGLYALSQGDSPGAVPAGSPALPDSGELLRVEHDGTLSVVAEGLDLPTSVDFVRDTAYVVTLTGEVLRIRNVSHGDRSHHEASDHKASDDVALDEEPDPAQLQGYGHRHGCGGGHHH
ncbi:ScyD/ScyE family protein [Planctomonas deserti]|uniref:ScyD/ScyE family protein n=1 Tax=Planctomonas deserti TaxID=2144185 RepID=UPI00131F3439|nr:ScyD/ScyE family protein [Planctomonas deserti]